MEPQKPTSTQQRQHLGKAEMARREAMRLHPSNHAPSCPLLRPAPEGEEMLGRWERLRQTLVAQGLSEAEALTETARIGAFEVWGDFAGRLRGHRAAGEQIDANLCAVALRSLQGVDAGLTRHRGDPAAARAAIQAARLRLRRSGALLDRLHEGWNAAFTPARRTFDSLEAFLLQGAEAAAAA